MAGLRMIRNSRGGAVLEIPIKSGDMRKFFTSISGLRQFVEGKRDFIYFNPFADINKEDG